MNISEFRSTVFNSDLARDNLFEFSMTNVPAFIREDLDYGDDVRNVSVYTKGVTFSPNSVTNNPRLGDGYRRVKPIQDVAHESDLEITLLTDPEHIYYMLFEDWITNMMIEDDTVRYFDDVTGSCLVKQLNRHGMSVTEFKFEDIYPISISSKVYAAGSSNTPSEFTVNFSYRDLTII